MALSQLSSTAGAMVGSLLSMIFSWLPNKIRIPFCMPLGGAAGSVLAIGLASLIFNKWVGQGTFGVLPFLAVTIALSIPIYIDFRRAGEPSGAQDTFPAKVGSVAWAHTSGMYLFVLGELAGIVVGAILFL